MTSKSDGDNPHSTKKKPSQNPEGARLKRIENMPFR